MIGRAVACFDEAVVLDRTALVRYLIQCLCQSVTHDSMQINRSFCVQDYRYSQYDIKYDC